MTNTIKLSGIIVKKEKLKNKDLRIVLAMPLHMKTFDNEGNVKRCFAHFSFTIVGIIEDEEYSILRKGNFVEIVGYITSNCKEDGTILRGVEIIIKSVAKGVK